MSAYRMDAQAARGLLADYMSEDDDDVTSPERVAALADALHDALREIAGHREAQALVAAPTDEDEEDD